MGPGKNWKQEQRGRGERGGYVEIGGVGMKEMEESEYPCGPLECTLSFVL